jgi:hypothetical protein
MMKERLRGEGPSVLVLFTFSILWFYAIETIFPRYFLWDDNATFFLPTYLLNFNTLQQEGVVPIMNFFQFAGWNHLHAGQTGVLYPPAYLAAWFASDVLGSGLYTIDTLAIMHLIGGMLGAYCWLRTLGVTRGAATMGAILYLTLPFTTILTRSWIFISFAHCFVPICFCLLERQCTKPSGCNFALYTIAKTLFVFAGYIQYVVYLSIFELAYILLRSQRKPNIALRYGCTLVCANAVALLLSLPALFPMAEATSLSANRAHPLSILHALEGFVDLTHAILAQFFFYYSDHAQVGLNTQLLLGGSIVIYYLLLQSAPVTSRMKIAVALFFLAVLLSTPFHFIISIVPIINRFRWPFKMFLFAGFFYITICSLLLDLLFSRKTMRRPVFFLLFAFALLSHISVLPSSPRQAYTIQSLHNPFAKFSQQEFRVASLGLPSLDSLPPYTEKLPTFNLSTIYQTPTIAGYDPLVSSVHKSIANYGRRNSGVIHTRQLSTLMDHLSQWSVRYFLSIVALSPEDQKQLDLRRVFPESPVIVYENPHAFPIAAFTSTPRDAIDIEYRANRMRLSTQDKTGSVLIRVAPIEGYQLQTLSGKRFPATRTASGIVITVDQAQPYVDVVYRSASLQNGMMGSVIGMFAMAAMLMWEARRKNPEGAMTA